MPGGGRAPRPAVPRSAAPPLRLQQAIRALLDSGPPKTSLFSKDVSTRRGAQRPLNRVSATTPDGSERTWVRRVGGGVPDGADRPRGLLSGPAAGSLHATQHAQQHPPPTLRKGPLPHPSPLTDM